MAVCVRWRALVGLGSAWWCYVWVEISAIPGPTDTASRYVGLPIL